MSFDAVQNKMVLEFNAKSMDVYTSLIGPFEFRIGSLYQCIGEGFVPRNSVVPSLRARVVRNVDGLDLNLFSKALESKRKFLTTAA